MLKQPPHWRRSGVIENARMSGIPHSSAAPAPPESKEDIEPTAANASLQARVYACWSAPASALLSSWSTSSLRPQRSPDALKYAA